MPTLEDASKISSLYTMFTGTPGVRKSTQALSYPKPQYWFSWDRKMTALVKPMRDWKINPRDVTYDNYTDWSTAARKLESFGLGCQYKTIILDSVTSLADSSLRQVARTKGAQDKGKVIGGINVSSIEDYNAESSALMEMISLTKDLHANLGINVILIAHIIQAEYKSNPNSAANIVRTIVTAGKRVAPKIPAYADEVYNFFLEPSMSVGEEGSYSLITAPTTDDFARTVLPLPRKITFGNEPLYDKFIKPAINNLNNPSIEPRTAKGSLD